MRVLVMSWPAHTCVERKADGKGPMDRPGMPKMQTAPIVQKWSDTLSYQAATRRRTIRSILVLKLDHVGDFILGFDAMLRLRESFPDARIDLACAPWNVDLARSLGLFQTIFPVGFFASRADGTHPGFDPAATADLSSGRWDLAIDLRVDPDTRVVLAHVDALFKVGFESPFCQTGMLLALPHKLPYDADANIGLHQTLLMLRLVRSTVDLFDDSHAVKQLLLSRVAAPCSLDLSSARGRILVACNTSSGRKVKNWPADRFSRLILWLTRDLDTVVLLIGGKDQISEAEEIVTLCGSRVISAVGATSLNQAIGLVSQASLYIGNDSGLTHVAGRLDIPTVALFSGIDPTSMWATLGKNVTILKAPVPCSPCHISSIRDCTNQQACVLNISESAVRAAVRTRLLEARRYGEVTQPQQETIQDIRRSAAYAGWIASNRHETPQRYSTNYSRYTAIGGHLNVAELKHNFMVNGSNNVGDLNRFYMLNLVFDQIIKEQLQGDIAELGVYKGSTASMLAALANRLGCFAYLFDTFEGFSQSDLSGVDADKKLEFSDTSLGSVGSLVGSDWVRYVQGYFPATCNQVPDGTRFCLVHIDCDLYAPFKAALSYFYERLVPGGFMIMHDYSSLHWDGAERAVDEFFADKPETVVPIPDGSGTAVVRRAKNCATRSNWFEASRSSGFANGWLDITGALAADLLESGWAQPESWGTWGLGESHVLRLEFHEWPKGDIELAAETVAVLCDTRPLQAVRVCVDAVAVDEWSYSDGHNRAVRIATVPREAVRSEKGVPTVLVSFRPRWTESPNTLDSTNSDIRPLGMGLIRLRQRQVFS